MKRDQTHRGLMVLGALGVSGLFAGAAIGVDQPVADQPAAGTNWTLPIETAAVHGVWQGKGTFRHVLDTESGRLALEYEEAALYLDSAGLREFAVELDVSRFELAPGETRAVEARVTADNARVARPVPLHYEAADLFAGVEGAPDSIAPWNWGYMRQRLHGAVPLPERPAPLLIDDAEGAAGRARLAGKGESVATADPLKRAEALLAINPEPPPEMPEGFPNSVQAAGGFTVLRSGRTGASPERIRHPLNPQKSRVGQLQVLAPAGTRVYRMRAPITWTPREVPVWVWQREKETRAWFVEALSGLEPAAGATPEAVQVERFDATFEGAPPAARAGPGCTGAQRHRRIPGVDLLPRRSPHRGRSRTQRPPGRAAPAPGGWRSVIGCCSILEPVKQMTCAEVHRCRGWRMATRSTT